MRPSPFRSYLELTGAPVTIDAMGTQTQIAGKIVRGGGDYLLALKANRPVLHRDLVAFFDDPPADMLEQEHHTTDGSSAFPHLAMIGMVETRVERHGALGRERRYSLSSKRLDAKTFAVAFAPIGVSRTGCIGFSTSSSTTISPGSAATTGRKTWRSSNTSL